jgi:hypothetical protein
LTDVAKVACDSVVGIAGKCCLQFEACHPNCTTAESADFTITDRNFTANGYADPEGHAKPNTSANFNCDRTTYSCANASGNRSTAGIDLCHVW